MIKASNYLMELGLTGDEASIYELLVTKGSLSAKGISKELGIVVNSIYRSTNTLLSMGLIVELDVSPMQFQSVSPKTAIKSLVRAKTDSLNNFSQLAIEQLSVKKEPNRLSMDVITGRAELFEKYVELVAKAKTEILVISVGEPVPEEIWSATQKRLDCGVSAKFIFHKNNRNNALLIKRWQAMGVLVKHLPSDGYHLNVFDNKSAILSASNPKQTKERTGVVIYNEAVIEALRTLFFQQWAVATKA